MKLLESLDVLSLPLPLTIHVEEISLSRARKLLAKGPIESFVSNFYTRAHLEDVLGFDIPTGSGNCSSLNKGEQAITFRYSTEPGKINWFLITRWAR